MSHTYTQTRIFQKVVLKLHRALFNSFFGARVFGSLSKVYHAFLQSWAIIIGKIVAKNNSSLAERSFSQAHTNMHAKHTPCTHTQNFM